MREERSFPQVIAIADNVLYEFCEQCEVASKDRTPNRRSRGRCCPPCESEDLIPQSKARWPLGSVI